MKMYKFAKLVAWMAVALGAVSCESSDSTQKNTQPDASTGETIEFFNNWSEPGDAQAIQLLLDAHKKRYPADTVIITTVTGIMEYFSELSGRISAGNPPDVFVTTTSRLMTQNPLSLNEFLASPSEAEVLPNLYPELVQDVTSDGTIYAMPWQVNRLNTLYYNRYVFSRNNLDVPTTIDELRTVCESLKTAGVTPIGATTPYLKSIVLASLLAGAMGIDAFHSYVTGESDETALSQGIDVVAELIDSCIDPSDFTVDETTEASLLNAFMKDDIAMFIDAKADTSLAELGWTSGTDFSMVAAPGTAGLFIGLPTYLAVSSDAPHLQGAWHFMDTATSPDAEVCHMATNSISPRKDVQLSAYSDERRRLLEDMMQAKYRVSPSLMAWNSAASNFMKSNPHDKAALLQFLLDLPR